MYIKYILIFILIISLACFAILFVKSCIDRPFSESARQKIFAEIDIEFKGKDGSFNYKKFELLLLRQFKLLDMQKAIEISPEKLLYYIYFLKTRRFSEIENIIPILKKYQLSPIEVCWDESRGFWPFDATAHFQVTIGDACTEVLKHHNVSNNKQPM